LTSICSQVDGVTSTDICKKAFSTAAAFHGKYWCDSAILDNTEFLRGALWYRGFDEGTFQSAQKTAIDYWEKIKERFGNTDYAVKWNPSIVQILDASFSKGKQTKTMNI